MEKTVGCINSTKDAMDCSTYSPNVPYLTPLRMREKSQLAIHVVSVILLMRSVTRCCVMFAVICHECLDCVTLLVTERSVFTLFSVRGLPTALMQANC